MSKQRQKKISGYRSHLPFMCMCAAQWQSNNYHKMNISTECRKHTKWSSMVCRCQKKIQKRCVHTSISYDQQNRWTWRNSYFCSLWFQAHLTLIIMYSCAHNAIAKCLCDFWNIRNWRISINNYYFLAFVVWKYPRIGKEEKKKWKTKIIIPHPVPNIVNASSIHSHLNGWAHDNSFARLTLSLSLSFPLFLFPSWFNARPNS